MTLDEHLWLLLSQNNRPDMAATLSDGCQEKAWQVQSVLGSSRRSEGCDCVDVPLMRANEGANKHSELSVIC